MRMRACRAAKDSEVKKALHHAAESALKRLNPR